MACNITTESVLRKIRQDHLECSICTCPYKRPKVLDCFHTFCLKCLQELRALQAPDMETLTCPLCRRDTRLEGEDLEDLPTNFTLSALVEEVRNQELLLMRGQGSEVKCQNCDEGNRAVSRCATCDQFLCSECRRAHDRMSVMKSHQVYSLMSEPGRAADRVIPTGRAVWSRSKINVDAGDSTQTLFLRRTTNPHPGKHFPQEEKEPVANVKTDWRGLNSALSFKPDRSLRKLEPEWELMTEVEDFNGAWVVRVAAFSDNEIVACAKNEQMLFTFQVSEGYGSYPMPQELPLEDLSGVKSITVSPRDQLIVLDGLYVKVFDQEGELLHQFQPGGPGGPPTCLASADGDLIAVGYADREVITLHAQELDGSLVKTLPAPMIRDYLIASGQRLIYTNYLTMRLVAVDHSGAQLFSVDMTGHMRMNQSPKGVCCDPDGGIYVAAWGSLSGDIHHYSRNGKYIGCVIEECDNPYDITFTSDGDIAVAALKSIKIYRHL